VSQLEDVWRRCAPGALAALARRYGDFDSAEDAVQEALVAASRQWPVDGQPDDPCAWIMRVASRRFIDRWRADRARVRREEQDARRQTEQLVPDADDTLTLMLLCCHPALTRPSQVALTLRAVGGLTTAQIARGFLVPEATMAQRISRAKQRLRDAGTSFALPTAVDMEGRVATLATVLYLIFTEAHTATSGDDLTDASLSATSIRLVREVQRRLPADRELAGLLALMLLTDARRAARTDVDGSLVPLARQDRSRWDRNQIAEGLTIVERALPTGPVGPYQLQAAIAAVHAEAVTASETDWPQIEVLYRMLSDLTPSSIVTLNHAVAVANVFGPHPALDMIRPLLHDERAARHHRVHAVHAHLLEMAHRTSEANVAFRRAARLATSIPEQRYLNARIVATTSPSTLATKCSSGC